MLLSVQWEYAVRVNPVSSIFKLISFYLFMRIHSHFSNLDSFIVTFAVVYCSFYNKLNLVYMFLIIYIIKIILRWHVRILNELISSLGYVGE